MADDPSIDEILESLDHLLKDGVGRNDDFPGEVQDETDELDQQPESREKDAESPEQPVAAPPGDIAQADYSSAPAAEETPDLESLAVNMEDGPHPPRMLLSASMLVNDPQEHLSFDNNAAVEREGSGADDVSEGAETAEAPHQVLDDAKIEELAHHVSDKLIQRLHARLGEVLPGMVAEMVDDAVRQYMEGLSPGDEHQT